jgi:hypothetical protein
VYRFLHDMQFLLSSDVTRPGFGALMGDARGPAAGDGLRG